MKPIIIFVHGFFFFSAGFLVSFLAFYFYLWRVGIVPDFSFYLAASCGGCLTFLNFRHILLNWVYLEGSTLLWSYSNHCYELNDLWSFSCVRNSRSLDGLKVISRLNLRRLPLSLTLVTVGELREQLFGQSSMVFSKSFNREYFSTFVFAGGDSFLFYTQPYGYKGLSKFYHYLQSSGVKVVG